MNQEDLSEYIRASEPHKRQRAENWRVAIGLQKVDGLNTSEYLVDAARRNIEGEISLAEVRKLLDGYYKARSAKAISDERTEEADKVSQRIAEILAEPAFTFAPSELIFSTRKCLLEEVLKRLIPQQTQQVTLQVALQVTLQVASLAEGWLFLSKW